jgi:hypothetical protein
MSFLAYLIHYRDIFGPRLVVVPKFTMLQKKRHCDHDAVTAETMNFISVLALEDIVWYDHALNTSSFKFFISASSETKSCHVPSAIV